MISLSPEERSTGFPFLVLTVYLCSLCCGVQLSLPRISARGMTVKAFIISFSVLSRHQATLPPISLTHIKDFCVYFLPLLPPFFTSRSLSAASLGHWGWLLWQHLPTELATFPVTVATGSLQDSKWATPSLSLSAFHNWTEICFPGCFIFSRSKIYPAEPVNEHRALEPLILFVWTLHRSLSRCLDTHLHVTDVASTQWLMT